MWKQSLAANDYSNYLVGSNLVNAFAFGAVGSSNDFFLLGAEPSPDTDYPLLTGNILDSEGNPLFRLVRNVLVFNPRSCSKVHGDHIGYAIHDGTGVPIMKVETRYDDTTESYVTRLAGRFFDKQGREVLAIADDENGTMDSWHQLPLSIGFNGTDRFSIVLGMSDPELEVASLALRAGGTVHEILSGSHKGETILLDGKVIKDCELEDCTIVIRTGDFWMPGRMTMLGTTTLRVAGPAKTVQQFLEMLRPHLQ